MFATGTYIFVQLTPLEDAIQFEHTVESRSAIRICQTACG